MTEVQIKLDYVTPETLPSGAVRYRFRRYGQKITLRGEPGSPEFLAHYAALLAGEDRQDVAVAKGSITWLVGQFLRDEAVRVEAGLCAASTHKGHKHHLGRLVEHYGAKDMRMPRKAVLALRDRYAGTPGAADNLRKAISALYAWAIEREHVTDNPAKGVPALRKRANGFEAWTIEDVRRYLLRHGPGTMARRALILELCTAARRGDLVTLGRFNERQYDGQTWLRWTQEKPPHAVVEIPMLPMLADEVDKSDGIYLLTAQGRPFTKDGFGNRFRAWCNSANVSGSLHGVRKGISSIMAELGATSYEVDVLLGHSLGSQESQVYTASAQRRAIARGLSEKMGALKW